MSQDIVADSLNKIMNAKKAKKDFVLLKHHSKLLLSLFAIAKLKGYIKRYAIENDTLKVEFDKLNYCKAIKPRFAIKINDIDKYLKRYLPAKDIGILIISTSKGLMTHTTSIEKKIGGSLLAYFY